MNVGLNSKIEQTLDGSKCDVMAVPAYSNCTTILLDDGDYKIILSTMFSEWLSRVTQRK